MTKWKFEIKERRERKTKEVDRIFKLFSTVFHDLERRSTIFIQKTPPFTD